MRVLRTSITSPLTRTLTRALLAVLAATGVLLGGAAGASADSFRYWGFYQWTDGAWGFATTGPAETVPADGAVDGWRFAVADESSSRVPRASVGFDEVCGTTEAGAGEKRVAVVLDFGTDADAPEGTVPEARGECAVVPEAASSLDALTAVAEARIEGGLVCGVDTFPGAGCGDPVPGAAPTDDAQVELALPDAAPSEDATDSATNEDGPSGDEDSSTATILAAVVTIGAIATLGIFAWRRRRPAGE